MKTVKRKKAGSPMTIHKFVKNLSKQRSCDNKKSFIENFSQAKRSEVFCANNSKKIKLSEFSKDERIKNTPVVTMSTNKETGQYETLLNFIESLKEDSMPNTTLQSQDESTKNSTVAMENVYESVMNNQTIKQYFQVAKDTKFPECLPSTNKETGHYERLLNFMESLKEDSMPNTTLQSQDERTKNSTVARENVYGSVMNNQTIKQYFQVAKDTKFPECSFGKCTTQQKIKPYLKRSSNKENIERSHLLSTKNDIAKTNSIFKKIQVASKRKELNQNESIINSTIIAVKNKIQQQNSEMSEMLSKDSEKYSNRIVNSIEKSSKQDDMESSVLGLSKRSTLNNFLKELDQNYVTCKTQSTKQKDTFNMEEHNMKYLGKKISLNEFTDRLLQEINDETESNSAKDTFFSSASSENLNVTVNNKLHKWKANHVKSNQDIPIFSNLSIEYNGNDKVKEFHTDNCMKELSDFSNVPSKIVNKNYELIDNSPNRMLKVNEGKYLKKSSETSLLPSKKADFSSVQAKHSKQIVMVNKIANEAQHKLEPLEMNEIFKVKSKGGKGETSKLENFETIQPKTSSSLMTHNKRKINFYYSRHTSTENNYFDPFRDSSKSLPRSVSREINSNNNNSIPIKNDLEVNESSDIDCINPNNIYLSDILSKENNLLELGGIVNQKCTEKTEMYASQDAIKSTITDNRRNLNSSYNDYITLTDKTSDTTISENQRNLQSSHNDYIAQTDNTRSSNYSKASALLDDELLKSILIKNYKSHKRKTLKECSNLKDLFTELTQDFQVDMVTNEIHSNKCHIERFRKGKVKIYRLKKLKKMNSMKKETQEVNLNLDELVQRITQDFVESKSTPAELDSCYSVSTPSSYNSDNARSETLSTGSKNLSSPDRRLRQGLNELSKDQNLLYCDSQYEHTTDYSKDEIKLRIQDIFLQVFDDLTNGRPCLLTYRRQCYENCELRNDRLQFKNNEWVTMSEISSSSKRSEAKFKLIMFILKKIQTLLETNTKLTKRELYYQFKNMIKGQSVTDRAINTISSLLGVGMWSLNILAQKGLVFGNLRILMSSGETLNCNIPGTLIPQDVADISEIHSIAYFILVVEKEAIFHKLIEEDLPNKLTRPFIMITGKGFPDLNTQLFLKKLWMIMAIPVFILVDADPHGINIMLNYRFGSVANAHVSHHLAVPRAKWLGVYPSEIVNFNITRQPMTEKELKLVGHLLKTPYMDRHPRIAEELKVLQERNFKAGIEGLIKSDIFLSQVYLPMKFSGHNFI